MLIELLYADDSFLMSETIGRLGNKFIKWTGTFDSKGWKVNLGNTKVIASGSITKDGLSKSNAYPCGVCSLSVKANSVLCIQCDKWIHNICARVKRVIANFS